MEEFKIKFRGVRGSYPVPKADFLKYAGTLFHHRKSQI